MRNRSIFKIGALHALAGIPDQSVDLVATDPPFNKGTDFAVTKRLGGEDAYADRWHWDHESHSKWCDRQSPHVQSAIRAAWTAHTPSQAAFLVDIAKVLQECKRVLKPTGSIFIQCDQTANAYLRILIDAIFGWRNFRNEIAWCYDSNGRSKSSFAPKHDTIFWYSKGEDYHFEQVRVPVSGGSNYNLTDESGRKYLVRTKNGKDYISYEDEGRGCYDWWADIKALNGMSGERIGYPTQKPLALYERIVKAACPKGGWVLDPFCGSGTTLLAAERLGRKWIGSDHGVSEHWAPLIKNRFPLSAITSREEGIEISDSPPDWREECGIVAEE